MSKVEQRRNDLRQQLITLAEAQIAAQGMASLRARITAKR